MRVTALARYPVKSCRGESLPAALVHPWGLAGDRRWMIVDPAGEFVSGREHPSLVLVTPELDGPLLRLRAPGRPDLVVAEPPGAEQVPVGIWDDRLSAAPAPAEADEWFSDYLGARVRLVFLDDPRRRPVDPEFATASDVVSFADAYPLLLTSADSLDALNDRIWEGRWSGEAPLPLMRFRPNVVVAGAPAWAEDGWKRLRIGPIAFRAAKACARCLFTTVDPDTADKGHEPLWTLARHRRWDGKLWFGINLIPDLSDPDQPSGALHVGDPVEIID